MTIDYNNGKIYKIVDNKSDMIYIGSTCKTLDQRLNTHKKDYKNFKAGNYHNISSFKILENNNYKIELVKLYPCKSKKELELEEGKKIKQFKNDGLNIVNRIIVGQTDAEYRQNNKAKLKEYKQNNKDKTKEYDKKYRQNNKDKINQKNCCSCGGKFIKKNKSSHEKTKKHCEFINAPKIIIPGDNNNITINIYCNGKNDLNNLNIV